MPRFKTEHDRGDGWSRWVLPLMRGYRMACCDCALVHDMEFAVVRVRKKLPDGSWEYSQPLDPEKFRVLMRARRNNRSTSRLRKRAH